MAENQKPHLLVLPFPAEGHINPLLNFAKRLIPKRFRITFIIAVDFTKKSAHDTQDSSSSELFNIEYISNGSNEGEEPDSLAGHFRRLHAIMSRDLVKLTEKLNRSDFPPKVLVYDSTLTWALDVAHQMGLLGASFFTQSCAVSTLYYHLQEEKLSAIPDEEHSSVLIPPLPLLQIDELPSFTQVDDKDHTIVKLMVEQFSNVEKANWIFFNSFDKLEYEVANWMARKWSIKTVGPTILKDNKHHGACLVEMKSDACLKWLDERDCSSVVYVSLGSVAVLGEEQMEELARGIAKSDHHFLWMVRDSEECKLPANFESEISEKGLIVNWCPQLEVLAHQALSCFMTHCGWNSMLEALISGVPMIAMPQIVDQFTNAKFVADVWQTGVRVKANDKGIVTREEISMSIKAVTEGDSAKEFRRNAEKWKELAQEAVRQGGSSHNNIDEFVSQVLSV
ncbi:UDP glycosyltransferase 9-like [Coffea arabica]|uniref:Glycosyltransferase n=1 Tax=Coffea arabica TaxID=13443 RepID=A0A6P6WVV1_COFAR|nr:UDP-glycosyltransferase 74E2-like [Coffea arabica]